MLGLSSFYRRNAGKIPLFLPPPFSLFYFVSSPSLLFTSPSFLLFFFFFPFLPFLSTEHPSFCLLPSHFLIFSFLIFLLFLSFFPFFHFLFYFFFFFFSFLFLIWITSTEWSKSGGNFPPLSSIVTCHHHHFSHNFLIFLFPLFPSFETWLNVSHSHKYTT